MNSSQAIKGGDNQSDMMQARPFTFKCSENRSMILSKRFSKLQIPLLGLLIAIVLAKYNLSGGT